MTEEEWAMYTNEILFAKLNELHPKETEKRKKELIRMYCGIGVCRDSILKFLLKGF